MSKERPTPIEQANEFVNKYSRDKLTEYMKKIHNLEGSNVTYDGLSDLLKEANSWVKWVGVSKKVFEEYRYRAFIAPDGSIEVVQGKEIDSEP